MVDCLLKTTTLCNHPFKVAIGQILNAVWMAIQPTFLLPSRILLEDGILRVANKTYLLNSYHKIILIAIGKASATMASAWFRLSNMPRPATGIVVVKQAVAVTDEAKKIPVIEGGHPLPDERSLRAGQRIKGLLTGLRADNLVICLISGGGSAMVTLPPPGVTLRDIQILTDSLLRCGAAITEINVVRRHLDCLKGGGLARMAFPAHVLTLILSDVLGNSLEAVASGPTVPDPTTKQDALAVLERYGLQKTLPRALLDAFLETPKPGDEVFARVQNVVIGSNRDALQAALRQAKMEGFHSVLLCDDLRDEAREAARALCRALRGVHERGDPVPRPACLIAGGETIVTLGDSKGRGGRNQELALAAVNELAGLPDVLLIALATDGEDGPTDVAGAVVNGETAQRAWNLGLDPDVMLQQHDSYAFFTALGDAIRIGPTGTNVNDIVLLFAF